MSDVELACQIGLSHSLLSSRVLIRLVEAMGTACDVWVASESALREHLSEKQVEKLSQTRKSTEPEQLLSFYQSHRIQVLSLSHPDYPPLLRFIQDPPFLLYVRGESRALQQEKSLAIVGTRQCTDYGQQVVKKLAKQMIPYEPCIISGLAIGIDTLAHKAALKNGLPTVAVFGTGINQVYPGSNRTLAEQIVESGGALVSELPADVSGVYFNFPKRNRVIAGLSQGTLVVEGDLKSGALITAKFALEENRQVLAIPGSILNPVSVGPNRLIQQGAVPVLSDEDIAESLGWQKTKEMTMHSVEESLAPLPLAMVAELSSCEKAILEAIGHEPVPLESIQMQRKEIPIGALNTALTMLELQGLITALPGAKFCRN